MRAMPIDSFFERLDDEHVPGAPDASLTWTRIVAEGRAARTAADGGRWRVGALALLVERRYASGALQRFAEEIGESYATVRRYRWVTRAYDPAVVRTRFSTLSFSHFQAVAGMPDRLTWLERAARGSWSVDRLTRESRPAADASTGPTALERMRTTLDGAKRSLRSAAELDDAALVHAGRAWLADSLDELAVVVESARDRLRRATRAADAQRPFTVARPNGRPASKLKTPAALKARAIGR